MRQTTAGWARLRLIAGAAVGAAAVAVAVAGCGTTSAPGHPAAPAAAAASAAKVAVTITVRGPGGATPRRWTLQCDPPGGTHPDPAAACRVLLSEMKLVAARPGRLVCPMILANAEQATISGTWYGRQIHRVVVDGGCDIRLWTALGRIFS